MNPIGNIANSSTPLNLARAQVLPAYLGVISSNPWPRRRGRYHRPPASSIAETSLKSATDAPLRSVDGLIQTLVFGLAAFTLGYGANLILGVITG